MSSTIDKPIVEIQFDNQQFEKNVQTSLNSITALNKSLDMPNAAKGFENINTAAKNVNFSGVSSAIDTIQSKFSTFEVMVITTLANITNSALEFGKKMITSFVEPMKTGFQEYETQINAVQTILANTSMKGTTIDQVNKALDELNTYSDKTIYNFTEMTKNIGTFTSAGVDLNTSVSAIKGIANLAAVSGSNSYQAATAMYQLSQALASGTVKLMDWNSVVNAGMGGQVFQDALKETAKAHGIAIDEMIKGEGSFRDTLKDGWLTSDVLTETLAKFTGDLSAKQLQSMGYAEDQITAIMKMGQTANDAATKVKTITQLLDTLREANQSGWTQTWEIIVGDFEEAKSLLTEVSNSFGVIISASAASRNSMLQGWKDLGGRTLLIEALRNSLEGVASIVKPITEAFKEIFPPTTGKQLYDLTAAFEKLTEKFVLNKEESENLKTTFKALFMVVDGVITVIKSGLTILNPLLDFIGYIGSNIIKVTGILARSIFGIKDYIGEISSFEKGLTNLIDTFKEFIGSIKVNFIIPGLDSTSSLIKKTSADIVEFKNMMTSFFNDIGESSKSGLETANERMTNFFTTINNIKNGLSNFSSKVKEAFSPVAGQIQEAFSDVTITDAIGTGMITGIILVIKKLLTNVDKIVSSFGDVMNSTVKVLDETRNALKAWQTSLKAETLFKIAAAVALLTVSLIALSFIDGDKLKNGLVGITLLLGEIVGTMEVLSKFPVTGVTSAAASMVIMSIAVSILAGALNELKDFQSWDETWPAIVAMGALMFGLVKSANSLSKNINGTEFIKTSIGILIFSASLKQMAKAMKSFAELNPDEIKKSLLTIGILLAEITFFIKGINYEGLSNGQVTIVAIATSLLILYTAVKLFGQMDMDVLKQGLLSVTGLLLGLSVSMRIIGSMDISGGMVTLIGLAGALTLLTIPIKELGAMNYEQLKQGLISVGLLLVGLTASMKILGTGNYIGVGTGLLLMAAGLALLAIPIKTLGSMPWQALVLGLGSVIVVLASFVGVSLLLAPLGPALLIVAGAFALFGVAAMAVGVGLAQLALGFATFAAIGAVGAAAIIATFAVLIPGLAALIPRIAELIVTGMTSFTKALAASSPILFESIAIIITTFLKMIRDVVPALVETVAILLVKLLETIAQYAPQIIAAGYDILISFMKGFADNIQEIVELGITIIVNFMNGIATKLPDVVQAGVNIVVSFIEGIANSLSSIIQSAFDLMIAFINGLTSAINLNTPILIEATNNLFAAIVNAGILVLKNAVAQYLNAGDAIMDSGFIQGIKSKIIIAVYTIENMMTTLIGTIKDRVEEFKDAAKHVISGFINGITDKIGDAVSAIKDFGSSVADALRDVFDINSPSRVSYDIAGYFGEGFINGLLAFSAGAVRVTKGIGTNVNNALSDSMSEIPNILNTNLDYEPVIKPILDLSNVKAGANQLYSMVGGAELSVQTSSQLAANAVYQRPSADTTETTGSTNNPQNGSPTFIQYNYSPKSLSRIEIYRQTKNLISTM